jgi:beta-glucosidase
MLYSRDMVASIVPENRRLRAFTKVSLDPGQTQTVTLTIKGSDLAFVDASGQWTLEPGDFRLQIGPLTTTLTAR